MNESDPMSILPPEIQTILKRKSSRDPTSRFSTKLHLLLSYVSQNPELEDKIGCAWVTEEEFRINKRALVNVMGIKINTLNVNLHTLGFIQQKHNKDGWTLWKRPNFTRTSQDITDPAASAPQPKHQKAYTPNFTLGPVQHQEFDNFIERCKQIWAELFQTTDVLKPINTNYFIEKAASRFKQSEQPTDNARDVLKAIIAPSQPEYIDFNQFCRFMAMFGPEQTIMLKIASLLSCSNATGQWLMFDKVTQNMNQFYGAFEETQPNCLVLNSKPQIRIWNLPYVDARNNQKYIFDQNSKLYSSWEEYFQNNPIPYPQTIHPEYTYQYAA